MAVYAGAIMVAVYTRAIIAGIYARAIIAAVYARASIGRPGWASPAAQVAGLVLTSPGLNHKNDNAGHTPK